MTQRHHNIETIKERLRERMAATGLSANAAGDLAGLGKSYVNDILSGKSVNPVRYKLVRVAEVLGCTLEWLTGEDDGDGDEMAIRVAQQVRDDSRDFAHALAVARLAVALSRC